MGAERIRHPRLISCDQTGIAAGGKGHRVAQFSCRLWPGFRCRLTSADILRETSLLMQDPSAYEAMARAYNPFGDGKASEPIVQAARSYFYNIIRK